MNIDKSASLSGEKGTGNHVFRRKVSRTRVKLCGMRRREDILAVNKILPDYAGFILAEGFRRTVTWEKARELGGLLADEIIPVGVFVNSPVEFAARMLNEHIIRIAQLHGDEDEEYIRRLRILTDTADNIAAEKMGPEHAGVPVRIIKVFKIAGEEDIKAAENSGADMILLDAGTGAGKTFDWTLAKKVRRPFILAGGLTPENVAAAIRQVRPYGVDVSSGVVTNGCKDPEKMRQFTENVRNSGEQDK